MAIVQNRGSQCCTSDDAYNYKTVALLGSESKSYCDCTVNNGPKLLCHSLSVAKGAIIIQRGVELFNFTVWNRSVTVDRSNRENARLPGPKGDTGSRLDKVLVTSALAVYSKQSPELSKLKGRGYSPARVLFSHG
jgi:hypothetical protein